VATYREEDDGFVVLNFSLDELSEQQLSQLDHVRRSVSRVTLKLPRRVARDVFVIGFDSRSGFVLVAPQK
jgi:hypothetical protein